MSNDKTYFSETVRRAARPRSRRRREQGTGGAVRGYSGGGTTSAAPAPTGHSHTNKDLLDSLRTDELNYLYKVRLNPGGSEAGQDKVRAGQADTAHDLTPDSPAYNRFLRKDADDKAAGVVDFLKGLRLAGKALTGILTTGDTAGASEANVLSALRTLATFLRKDRPDTMPHLLKLLDGVETGTFAAGRTGGRIDKQGNGELGSLTLRDLLTAVRLIADGVRSKNYTPGDMGTGFGLTTGEGGSRLEVDYLLVRRVATFVELLIREMRHVGGTLVLSGASGKVVRVEDKASAWRVYFKTREDGTTVAHGFTVGAQARCQTYNRTAGNTYYWRLVTAVGDDWVELSKSDYDRAAPTGTARTAPAVGDELVQLGHRTDARQTGAIVLDTVGEGAPSIRLLKDIRSYSLTDANVRVLLSPSSVRVIADEVSFASGKTVEQTIKDSKENAIEAAKEYANGIQQDLTNSLNTARTELEKHAADWDAALLSNAKTYADGQITESEKRMVEDNREKLQAEQEEATKRLNEAIASALSTAKGYVKDVQVGGRNYFGQHKGVATNPAGALSPDNNGVVFRNRDRLNCRIEKLNLPGVGWYAVSMFIRATKACTIASINLCDAVSKDKTLENVSVTTSFRYITGVFHAERYINDDRWNGFLDFESSIDPSIEVTVRDLMITPGNQPMSWVPAPEDIAAEIAAKAEAARQAAQSEAIGLNKWIAQAYYTGENKAATPPKLEDIAGKTPTRTLELKDAQFNLSGGGSVFNMNNYTGIRTTYVYLEADYSLTTGIQHDDAGSLYVNGALVASGGIRNTSWKSVTLPLKRGWNRIDGLWNEGGGGDFFKFQAPLENDAHIIQLACRPNVSIDPMRAVTMTTLTEKYSEIAETNESIKLRVGETEKSIQEVDNKVKGFTTVDKNGQVLIKPESVWAGVETKVQQLSDESLKKLSVGGRNLIRNSDTSAAPVAMKTPTDGTAYKIFPVKTTLVKHDCQEEESYTLTVWYTSTSQFPFESFPIGGKPGGDDWSVRFIASEGQITQEGGMKKCVMQAVVPKGGRVLYNPTVGFIYGANNPCNMNLYRVKLERGQKSTDWTPAPEDLPTIDTLTRTGIDIQQGVITLDAQKVKIQNGSQTMAMFEDGKLKADLIDAKRIKANDILSQNIVVGNNATITNLRAKNAVIEGTVKARSTYMPFVDVSAASIGQNGLLDPFKYGCNIILTNGIGTGVDTVRLPMTADYSGVRLAIFCPIITRSGTTTVLRGKFTPFDQGIELATLFAPYGNAMVELIAVPMVGSTPIVWIPLGGGIPVKE